MPPSNLTTEGRYRAIAISRRLVPSETSNAVGLNLQFVCTARKNSEGVSELAPGGAPWGEIEGWVWFVRRDGSPNPHGVRSLREGLGWSGNPADLQPGSGWKPTECEITVEWETYEGAERLRVRWVNAVGGRPGRRQLATAELAELDRKLGDEFRRICGELPESQVGPLPPPTGDSIPF